MKIRFSREAKFGLFGIVVLFALYWGINFVKGIEIFSSHNTVYVEYTKSDNIEISSPVLLRGIKIGSVLDAQLSPAQNSVILTLTMSGDYKIPVDSKLMITNKSMLGGKAVIVELGKSAEYISDGDQLQGVIDNNMQEQIDQVKAQLTETVNELTATLRGVNEILNDTTINSIKASIQNMESITASASSTMNRSGKKVENLISNLEGLSASLNNDVPAIMKSVRSVSDSLNSADIASTVRHANASMQQVNALLAAINNQEGSVGKFFYDTSAYDNLNSSLANLSLLLEDVKRYPKDYVQLSLIQRKDKRYKEEEKAAKRKAKEEAKK